MSKEFSRATYEQRSGLFEIWALVDDSHAERCLYQSVGYAGRGTHKNRPASEGVKGEGPLPRGFYRVCPPVDHPRLGPLAFRLLPYVHNEMFGRSGFFIHGDSAKNPGNASHGCIVLSRAARDAVLEYGVRYLEVVPGSAVGGDLK